MRPLRSSFAFLRRLFRHERGNFGMMLGIMAIPLCGFIGLAIDVTRAYMAKVELQGACDTAALAAATLHGQDDTTVKAVAAKYFYSNYAQDFWAPPTTPVVTIAGQQVTVAATSTLTNFFLRLFGYNTFDIAATATAMSQGNGIEVAMVLDITSSMSSQDMTYLKNASLQVVNILFGSQTTSPLLSIGVVPFTTSVRVDPTTFVTNNWVDKTGASSVARLNFDTSYANNYAYALYKAPNGGGYTQTPWVGCLEVRPNGLEETDTPPTSGNTLFVPYFAPDSPDDPNPIPPVAVATTANLAALSGKPTINGVTVTNNMRILVKNQTTTKNNGIYVTPASGSGAWTRATDANTPAQLTRAAVKVTGGGQAGTQWVETAIVTTVGTSPVTFASNNGTFTNDYLPDVTASIGTVAKQTYTKKYQGKNLSTADGAFVQGPNRNCIKTAIQPLTNNKTTLINMINGLEADGYTNIPIGIGWGWRVLSQQAPYTEGHADSDPDWQKILIIETDGCNTMPSTSDCTTTTPDNNPWGSDYGAYGFGFQERLGAGVNDTVKMMAAENTSMAKVCANIKAVKKTDGTPVYTIYTIGFGTEVKQNGNEALLKGCATTNSKTGLPNYYYAGTGADLEDAFSEIATEISKIRLTK